MFVISGQRRRYHGRPWWMAAESISISDVIAAWQPKGAASLAASYTDVSLNGRPVSPLVAPTLNASGWVFAGGQRINTGVIGQPGWSVLVRFSGIATGDTAGGCVLGSQVQGPPKLRWYIVPSVPLAGYGRIYGASLTSALTGRVSSGIMGLAGQQPYRDGQADGAAVGGTALPSINAWIGAMNDDGAPTYPLYGTVAAAGLWSRTLTAAEMAAISAAMAAL